MIKVKKRYIIVEQIPYCYWEIIMAINYWIVCKDFFHSFMMIFRILCGEWAEPLWDCMRAERNSVSRFISSFLLLLLSSTALENQRYATALIRVQ